MSGSRQKERQFDADQRPEQARRVRHAYRTLIKDVDDNKEELSRPENAAIQTKVTQADVIFRKVKAPREADLDSLFMHKAAAVGVEQARSLRSTSSVIDLETFTHKVHEYITGRQLQKGSAVDPRHFDWARLDLLVSGMSSSTPSATTMLGPISIERKARLQRKRSQRVVLPQAGIRPETDVAPDEDAQQKETSQRIKEIKAILTEKEIEGEELDLYSLVVNPKSFSQTVENIFHLAFEIKDGNASMRVDESGAPIVSKAEQPDANVDVGAARRQYVLAFDYETYNKVVGELELQDSTIPHRASVDLTNPTATTSKRRRAADEGPSSSSQAEDDTVEPQAKRARAK